MNRACLHPGCPNVGPTTRCPAHTSPRRGHDPRSNTAKGLGSDHQRMAKRVLTEEKRCWLCGGPGSLTDPLEADHVLPRSKGGTNVRSNYRAAHASCNRSRGNRIRTVPSPPATPE